MSQLERNAILSANAISEILTQKATRSDKSKIMNIKNCIKPASKAHFTVTTAVPLARNTLSL